MHLTGVRADGLVAGVETAGLIGFSSPGAATTTWSRCEGGRGFAKAGHQKPSART